MNKLLVGAACFALVAACESPEISQSGAVSVQPTIEEPNRATFVLVHGAYIGGYAWKYVAPLLRERGHMVYTPTLTGMGERSHLGGPDVDLDTHIDDIVNVLLYEDLEDVVLTGWSYGGMVVTGVLDRVPERIRHVVYLDAEVPRNGESLFDMLPESDVVAMEQMVTEIGDGWKATPGTVAEIEALIERWIPDIEVRRWVAEKMASEAQPIDTVRQPINLSNPKSESVPRTYIRCPVDGEIFARVFDPIFDRLSDDPKWDVIELTSNHMAPIANPEMVADSLRGVLDSVDED